MKVATCCVKTPEGVDMAEDEGKSGHWDTTIGPTKFEETRTALA